MKIDQNEFRAICQLVKNDFNTRFQVENLDLILDNLLSDPRISSYSYRVDTKKIECDLKRRYIKLDKKQSQDIERLIIFGQLYFSRNGCGFMVDKLEQTLPQNSALQTIRELCSTNAVEHQFSKHDTLADRKKFTFAYKELEKTLVNNSVALKDLKLARAFYFQLNDINFNYADTPSRCFSSFIRFIESKGSTLSLVTLAITMLASGLALFPALTPICAPIALVCGYITMGVGLPLAFKGISTMVYNAVRFKTAPTKGEVVKLGFLALGILSAGIVGGATACIDGGVFGRVPVAIRKLEVLGTNLFKCLFGGGAQKAQKKKKANLLAMQCAEITQSTRVL